MAATPTDGSTDPGVTPVVPPSGELPEAQTAPRIHTSYGEGLLWGGDGYGDGYGYGYGDGYGYGYGYGDGYGYGYGYG